MSAQLQALAVVGIVVLAAACLEIFRSRRARRLALRPSDPSGHLPINGEDPYILYFTGDSCTVCRTHQEPALAKLGGVRVDKVDAVAERSLADKFHVYTLPTTIVMAPDGHAVHVNYGYAPAPKLLRQLADARGRSLSTAMA